MHDHGENQRERGLNAAGARSSSGALPPTTTGRVCAGQVVGRNVVTLPAWFPAAKARAVLRLKRQPFALLSDARGAHAVVPVDELASAPPERSLSGCATPLGPAISAQLPIDEALPFMNRHAALYVPVVLGSVVLGVLSHAVAAEAVAAQEHSTLPLAA